MPAWGDLATTGETDRTAYAAATELPPTPQGGGADLQPKRYPRKQAVALVFFETGPPIEVTYAKATLHAGDRGLGLLLTAWGAGAVLGSAVFARFVKRPLGGMLGVGTVAIGLAYVGFAVAPSLGLACVAAALGGVGNGLQMPSLISIVQRITPQNLQGRMMGAVESLSALCRAIGLPLGGILVALSSPRIAFVIVGSGAVATTAALIRLAPGSRGGSAPAPGDHQTQATVEGRVSGVP